MKRLIQLMIILTLTSCDVTLHDVGSFKIGIISAYADEDNVIYADEIEYTHDEILRCRSDIYTYIVYQSPFVRHIPKFDAYYYVGDETNSCIARSLLPSYDIGLTVFTYKAPQWVKDLYEEKKAEAEIAFGDMIDPQRVQERKMREKWLNETLPKAAKLKAERLEREKAAAEREAYINELVDSFVEKKDVVMNWLTVTGNGILNFFKQLLN